MAVSGLTAPYEAGYMYLGGQLKFYVFDTPGVGYLPFIRSSEMVLIEAEANYFLNNEAAAQAALVELNATSGRNAEYTCTKTEMRYGTKSWTIVNLNYGEKALHGATINAGIVMSFATALTKVAMHTSLLLRLFRQAAPTNGHGMFL